MRPRLHGRRDTFRQAPTSGRCWASTIVLPGTPVRQESRGLCPSKLRRPSSGFQGVQPHLQSAARRAEAAAGAGRVGVESEPSPGLPVEQGAAAARCADRAPRIAGRCEAPFLSICSSVYSCLQHVKHTRKYTADTSTQHEKVAETRAARPHCRCR